MQTGLSPPSQPLPTPQAMVDPGGPRPAGGAAGRACGRRAGLWRCWAAHTEGSVRGRAPGQGRVPGRLTWRAGRTQQRRSQLRPTLPTCMDVGWRVCPRASLVLWPDPWGPSRPALQPPASVGSRAQPRAPAPLDIPPLSFLLGPGGAARLGIGPLSLEPSGALLGAQGPRPPAQKQGLRWSLPTRLEQALESEKRRCSLSAAPGSLCPLPGGRESPRPGCPPRPELGPGRTSLLSPAPYKHSLSFCPVGSWRPCPDAAPGDQPGDSGFLAEETDL